MSGLAHHFFPMACHNAWSNHRLLGAVAKLSQEDFVATRTSFFPSIEHTLNHNLTVDWYYVDALERAHRKQPPNEGARSFFDPERPFRELAPLREAQRAMDLRLVQLCRALNDGELDSPVGGMHRQGGLHEPLGRLLSHFVQHHIRNARPVP